MLADYHIHTHFSSDCEVEPEEHIRKAISKGISELCFTDHVDFDYPPEDGKEMFRINADEYFEKLTKLKHAFEKDIKIKIGIELGLNPANSKQNLEFLSKYPFDFVIGSSHIVDGIDPYYPEYWNNKSVDDAVIQYYEAVLRNVTAYDNYDVYGHLDYIRRYIPDNNYVYSNETFFELTDMILKNIIAKGHGIELNTRGLENGITEFIPTILLLRRYHELGGEIVTVGSDAHYVKKLGYGFSTAKDILINTGFKYIATYENRNLSFIPLA